MKYCNLIAFFDSIVTTGTVLLPFVSGTKQIAATHSFFLKLELSLYRNRNTTGIFIFLHCALSSIFFVSRVSAQDIIESDHDINMVTPTNSQEIVLLDGEEDIFPAIVDSKVANPKAPVLAPAKLIVGGAMARPATGGKQSEITVALSSNVSTASSAAVQTSPKRARSRSKAVRNHAKNAQKQQVDQLASNSSQKRSRESGETPPSVNRPTKKNKPRRNKNKAMSADSKPAGQNAATGNFTKASVPPVSKSTLLQSLGSVAGETPGPQPTVAKSVIPDNPAFVAASQQPSDAGVTNEPTMQSQSSLDGQVDVVEPENDQGSYALAVKPLIAIIDQRSRGNMTLMDQQGYDKLYTAITDTIMAQIGKSEVMPEFEDTRLHSGAMRLRCANEQTRQWLEKYVPLLDKKKLWKGASLAVIDFRNIPKPHKFNVFVRGLKQSAKYIFGLIDAQNKEINTKSWTALACEYKNGGTQMTIGVGQDSFDILRANSNSLYCGLGKATFTLVKSCKENRNAMQPSAYRAPSSTSTSGSAPTPNPPTEQMEVVSESATPSQN